MHRLVVLAALVLAPSAAAAPAPSIVASTTSGPAPLTVRFTAQLPTVDSAPAVVSYAWSFGDGATASGQAVSHRFVAAGRYAVTLTVTDALGGTAAATTEVHAQGLRLTLAPAVVVFGRRVVARGALVPPAAGARVAIERRAGSSWQLVKTARTDSAGRFHACVLPGRNGVWRARVGPLRSAPATLTVAPQLDVRAGAGIALVGAPLVVRSQPRTAAPVP